MLGCSEDMVWPVLGHFVAVTEQMGTNLHQGTYPDIDLYSLAPHSKARHTCRIPHPLC